MKYAFENLEVWQLSRKLVKSVYQLTRTLPNEKKIRIDKSDQTGKHFS
jgi:hypothetical protein